MQRGWATLCCSASSSCLQLYWARFLLRKWFNISATESDHIADSDDEEDDDSVADSDIEGLIFRIFYEFLLQSECTHFGC